MGCAVTHLLHAMHTLSLSHHSYCPLSTTSASKQATKLHPMVSLVSFLGYSVTLTLTSAHVPRHILRQGRWVGAWTNTSGLATSPCSVLLFSFLFFFSKSLSILQMLASLPLVLPCPLPPPLVPGYTLCTPWTTLEERATTSIHVKKKKIGTTSSSIIITTNKVCDEYTNMHTGTHGHNINQIKECMNGWMWASKSSNTKWCSSPHLILSFLLPCACFCTFMLYHLFYMYTYIMCTSRTTRRKRGVVLGKATNKAK